MRSLPLFKFGSRARSTSWGIALCTMFIVASFSIASGLNNSMDALERNFESDQYLITRPSASGDQLFNRSAVDSLIGQSAFGIFTSARVSAPDVTIRIVAFEGDLGFLPGIPFLADDSMLAGPNAYLTGNLTMSTNAEVIGHVVGSFQSPLVPGDWYLGSMSLLEDLTASTGLRSFAIASDVTESASSSLRADGFTVQPMAGIIGFLGSGVEEIEDDIMWALVPSAFVIAVLAYSFLGTETADKRHEIGVVKTLGAGRWKILRYLMSDALIIAAWGGLLGLALGIVLSYGLSTAASSLFSSVFVIKSSAVLLLEGYVATVLAALAGALLPALRMTLTHPVDDLKEVAPYS